MSGRPVIVWFRNDLRVRDNPSLARAIATGGAVVPVFICDNGILNGKHASPNRSRFLQECLQDLQATLRSLGSDLFIFKDSSPQKVLTTLIRQLGSDTVIATKDYSPFATKRDKAVRVELAKVGAKLDLTGGRLIVDDLDEIRTKAGTIHKVFTPFWRAWQEVPRRNVFEAPSHITPPPKQLAQTPIPDIYEPSHVNLSPNALKGGETEGLLRRKTFFEGPIDHYGTEQNVLSHDGTSRLSPYLHFGCISPLESSLLAPKGKGAEAWVRQLAWRDFYHYILNYNPSNSALEFQEKYRTLKWDKNPDYLEAWKQGKTGYPVVDAAMRQLKQEGWMHNRARLIVGSFLVKDLWIDWREGEKYFMRMLLDGDQANNNGNWQWIASVGVDPAPVYRRLYNPTSQAEKFDPDGSYIKKYVPELRKVSVPAIFSPHKLSSREQAEAGVRLGVDYPLPIIDHAVARTAALRKYRQENL